MHLVMWSLKLVLRIIYRVKVKGMANFHAAGDNLLIVANHGSRLDLLLLYLFVSPDMGFAVHHIYAKKWWVRILQRQTALFIVDHHDFTSMKAVIKHLKAGNKLVIFPEGRITNTGSLMKVYAAPAMVADKAGATLLPVYIGGVQGSLFSLLKGKLRQRCFPKVCVSVLEETVLKFPVGIDGRERADYAAELLVGIMKEMFFVTSPYKARLWDNLIQAAATHGKNHVILEDLERSPLRYTDFFTRCMVLQQLLPTSIEQGERVGLLLPNVNACAITFFALQAKAAVPAMLNYTMGAQTIVAALESATIQRVITSHHFIEAGNFGGLIETVAEHAEVIYLEDLREQLSFRHKLKGLWMAKFPSLGVFREINKVTADDAAVILFTSGSEGMPKGVVLSHQNILANVEKITACIAFEAGDVCLNALPMFHSFGLTAGTILPMMRGIKTFLYPSPLHYKAIPEIAYDIDATILFGTNLFLAEYGKYAHPHDFHCMRYVVAGAEKLQPETREMWMHKFGIRILEGYGATETSPVLSCNTPVFFKIGTVGRFLPSIEYRLEPVLGIDNGGRLFVRGENIMKGYLLHDKPGVLQSPQDGWYDTGDIVAVDAEGYIHIQGRAKRFAKIAGEMISLTAAEVMCKACWSDFEHIILSFPEPKKGEELVLLTTMAGAERKDLLSYARANGINVLQVPKKILFLSEIPLMGTGKVHYPAATALAKNLMAGGEEAANAPSNFLVS